MTVFDPGNNNHMHQTMFFGESVSVSRFDTQKYPIFERIIQKQLSFFWIPQEISLTNDRNDFNNLTDSAKHIFTSNLKYQILMDSIQGRSPNLALLPIVSIPELETWIETWSFFETIHSRSYTYIIQNVYANPCEILDSITRDRAIVNRSDDLCKYYDRLIKEKTISNLILTLVSIYILEAVRFYASFACSFIFAERGLMEGNAKIIKLIARDESLHAKAVEIMITNIRNGSEGQEYKNTYEDLKPKIQHMFDQAVKQEVSWVKYLFKDGCILGLNEEILTDYVFYLANSKLRNIGINAEKRKNPLLWLEAWFSSDTVQPPPQETEITSYLVGSTKQDININKLKDMFNA